MDDFDGSGCRYLRAGHKEIERIKMRLVLAFKYTGGWKLRVDLTKWDPEVTWVVMVVVDRRYDRLQYESALIIVLYYVVILFKNNK